HDAAVLGALWIRLDLVTGNVCLNEESELHGRPGVYQLECRPDKPRGGALPQALLQVEVRIPRRVALEDAEHLVSEAPVEVRAGLEAEGIQVNVPASPPGRQRFGGLEQLRAPAVAGAVLVDPEELDVQPRRPDVAEHAAADAVLL